MNYFTGKDFVFVICAYKESPYLEECIVSLLEQSISVRVIIVTSTPNKYIQDLAEKYDLLYYVNNGESGIAEDWNYALSKATGEVVTIAHQDDIYEPHFVRNVLENINKQVKPLIAFTNYGELRNAQKVNTNRLLRIKRVMLFLLQSSRLQRNRLLRRMILAFGSPICCPSVTYIKRNLPRTIFVSGYQSDLDWQAWEKISKLDGAFVYCSKLLMYHRIHAESATTAIIADSGRKKEDFEMFCKFWPKSIAKLLERLYQKGEKSNEL